MNEPEEISICEQTLVEDDRGPDVLHSVEKIKIENREASSTLLQNPLLLNLN